MIKIMDLIQHFGNNTSGFDFINPFKLRVAFIKRLKQIKKAQQKDNELNKDNEELRIPIHMYHQGKLDCLMGLFNITEDDLK